MLVRVTRIRSFAPSLLQSLRYQTANNYSDLKFKPEPNFKPSVLLELAKAKLASFVLLTTMTGYAMGTCPHSIQTLILTTAGTGLAIMSANTFNQFIEYPFDSQMSRTRNRPIVRYAISPTRSFLVAIGSGIFGFSLLATVNPICALLGLSNIVLYSGIYTYMKRRTIYNTWAGAVVGAIPPVIGYVANTGQIDLNSLILAASLFSWQLPHFNALSYNLKSDYAKAGYKMMSVMDPPLNARVALRYSLAMFPISIAACAIGMNSWIFLPLSTTVNSFMAYRAFNFYKQSGSQNARKLFFASLIHLPVFLLLLLATKIS